MKRSIQTAIALFAAVTTTMCFTGCAHNQDASTQQENSEIKYDENGNARLKDDKGNPYTLHKNSDGTETARYDDGKEVTFKRDPNTNEVHYESGSSSLLTGLLAGYLLFHGFGTNSGTSNFQYNPRSNTYTSSEPLQKLTKEEQQRRAGGSVITSGSGSSNSSPSNNNIKSSQSSSNSKSSSSSASSPKSGFGSAGARGGSS